MFSGCGAILPPEWRGAMERPALGVGSVIELTILRLRKFFSDPKKPEQLRKIFKFELSTGSVDN